MTIGFDVQMFARAAADYDATWRVTDDALVALCRRYPDHRDRGGVHAKLLLIGRGYATGVERRIKSTGTQNSSLTQLAEHLLQHAAEIDAQLARFDSVAEPLDPDRLSTIIDVHARVMKVVAGVTRKGMATRSFVSKYLHFHNPAVPIYDSSAAGVIPGLVKWRTCTKACRWINGWDKEYYTFCMGFFDLYDAARRSLPDPAVATVKRLDYYLLWLRDTPRSKWPA